MATTVDLDDGAKGDAPVQETTVTVVTRTVTPPPAYRPDEKEPSMISDRISTRERRLSIETGDATDLTNPSSSTENAAKNETKAPDGGYGWVIVFAVFMIHVILDGLTFSFGMLFPPILEEFQASKSTAAWIVSMLMGTTFFCGPVSSILSEKYSYRTVAFCGGIIAFLGAVGGSFARQTWHLIVTYGLIMGVGFGGVYLPAIVSVATWFDKRRPMAMGIAVCGSGIGIWAFSTVIPILIEEYGLRGCLLWEGAVVLHVLIFAALLRSAADEGKRTRGKARRTDRKNSLEMEELEKKTPPVKDGVPTTLDPNAGWWQKVVFNMPWFALWQYWVLLVVVFTAGIAGYIPFTYLTHRAMKEIGSTASDTGLLVSITGGCNLVGRLMSGLLSVQPWCNTQLLYTSAFIISGIATTASVYCNTFTAFAIYGGIYGWTGGIIIALQSIVMTEIVGIDLFSGAFGVSLFVLGFSALIGSPVAGAIVDADGGIYYRTFKIFGIMMLMGGLIFLPVPISNIWKRYRSRGKDRTAVTTESR